VALKTGFGNALAELITIVTSLYFLRVATCRPNRFNRFGKRG
jgi:hypothetical protein